MTRLAVGRAFDGIDVDPRSIVWDGDRVAMSGQLLTTSYGQMQVVRSRILSLVDTANESVVPLTFTGDSSMDGFYRVLSASCELFNHSPATFYGEWQFDLERVGRGALPQTEVAGLFGTIDALAITNGTIASNGLHPLVAAPGTAYDIWNGYTASSTAYTRTTETGAVGVAIGAGAGMPARLNVVYSVRPADAYIGACSIKGTVAGLTGQLVLGRQAAVDARGMVISNGFIRATVDASGILNFEVYDSGVWVVPNAKTWRLIRNDAVSSGYVDMTFQDVKASIIRNSPEQVVVRFLMASGYTADIGRIWLDISLSRGAAVLSCKFSSDIAVLWRVQPNGSVASTNLTGVVGSYGERVTSNDANGNRSVLLGTHVGGVQPDFNNATGQVGSPTVTKVWPWGLGIELNGSASTNMDTVALVAYEFYEAGTFTQRVVDR